MKHLSPEDLGKVVDLIMRKCPDAFEEQDNDNAQLLLDNLELPLFEELNEYSYPLVRMVRQMNDEYEEKLLKKIKQ